MKFHQAKDSNSLGPAQVPELEERLSRILAIVDGHLKFGEAKNAVLVALSGGALVGIAQILNAETTPGQGVRCYLYSLVVFLLGAGLLSLLSFMPKMQAPWMRSREPAPKDASLLFFGELRKLDSAELLERLSEATLASDRNSTPFEAMYAEQIVINSQIAVQKYEWFGCALWLAVAGAVTPIGALLVWYAKRIRAL